MQLSKEKREDGETWWPAREAGGRANLGRNWGDAPHSGEGECEDTKVGAEVGKNHHGGEELQTLGSQRLALRF